MTFLKAFQQIVDRRKIFTKSFRIGNFENFFRARFAKTNKIPSTAFTSNLIYFLMEVDADIAHGGSFPLTSPPNFFIQSFSHLLLLKPAEAENMKNWWVLIFTQPSRKHREQFVKISFTFFELLPQSLIVINEIYFTWNAIEESHLTVWGFSCVVGLINEQNVSFQVLN